MAELHKILYESVLLVAMDLFSSDGVTMRYVLTVLWMTLFSYHGTSGLESNTTLCFEGGSNSWKLDNYSSCVRVHQNVVLGDGGKVCYLQLLCSSLQFNKNRTNVT